MPIIRNPFRKQDENVRPITSEVDGQTNGAGLKPLTIKERDVAEYKLSEINDSGVFIPPSPTEEKTSFWRTSSSRSTTSSRSKSLFDEKEPFNISRESFDSYRRSFDISARSPVLQPDQKPRISLDSRIFLAPPRHSNSFRRPVEVPVTQQEEEPETLEDVSLDEPKPQPKKRGMLSRIMDSDAHSERPVSQDGAKTSWHHFGGRKRGASGQGAELGSIPKQQDSIPKREDNVPKREETPKPEIQMKKEERQSTPGAENAQAPDIKIDPASVR